VSFNCASAASRRPPGNEISPACRRRPVPRLVKTMWGSSSPGARNSGTSTAASTGSTLSAGGGMSTLSAGEMLRRHVHALDALLEHDLSVEHAVHRALRCDHPQPLGLILG
jgi:hypothetical protein